MAKVIVRQNESLDSAIKRFKSKIGQQGIIKSLRKNEEYIKPSDSKRQKHKEQLKKIKKNKK